MFLLFNDSIKSIVSNNLMRSFLCYSIQYTNVRSLHARTRFSALSPMVPKLRWFSTFSTVVISPLLSDSQFLALWFSTFCSVIFNTFLGGSQPLVLRFSTVSSMIFNLLRSSFQPLARWFSAFGSMYLSSKLSGSQKFA